MRCIKIKITYVIYSIVIIIFTVYFSVQIFSRINKITEYYIQDYPKNGKLPEYEIGFYRKSNNSVIEQELIPNYQQIFDGHFIRLQPTIVKINSDGFRDRDFSIKKNTNTFRIIALGDSFTFGWGLNLTDTWPKQLENKLNERIKNKHFEVLNFGVGGYNTIQEVLMFKEKGIKYNPDLLLLDFTMDDFENKSRIMELYNECEQKSSSMAKNKKNIICTEESYQLYRKELISEPLNENLKLVESPLSDLINITKKYNITMMIVIFPNIPGELQMKSEYVKFVLKIINSVKKMASKYEIPLIDLDTEVYMNYPNDKMILDPDDTHPSSFACNVISDKILEKLIIFNLIK
jgi:lysophospholipase L1-like esterase